MVIKSLKIKVYLRIIFNNMNRCFKNVNLKLEPILEYKFFTILSYILIDFLIDF